VQINPGSDRKLFDSQDPHLDLKYTIFYYRTLYTRYIKLNALDVIVKQLILDI